MSTPRFLDLPEGVRGARRATPAGVLAVLEASPGSPSGAPVVLVPGWTGSKEDFIAVLVPLAAAGHPAVAIDLPGQYESGPAPGHAYDLDVFGAAVLGVAAAADDGPVHLVGHSFGGLAVATAALQDPSAVRSVTLVCSGPGALPAEQHELVRVLADAVLEHGLEATWTAKRAYDRAHGAPEAPPHIEAFLQQRFTSNDPASLHAITVLLTTAPDRTAELAGTGLPLLVVTGEDDDRWPVDVQADMAARLGTRHVLLPGAGHSPAVETPEATAAALTDFWADVEALPRVVGE